MAAAASAAASAFAHDAAANQGATELCGVVNGVNGVCGISATTGHVSGIRSTLEGTTSGCVKTSGHVSGIRTGTLQGATSGCAKTSGLTEHRGLNRWFCTAGPQIFAGSHSTATAQACRFELGCIQGVRCF